MSFPHPPPPKNDSNVSYPTRELTLEEEIHIHSIISGGRGDSDSASVSKMVAMGISRQDANAAVYRKYVK